MQQRVHPVAPQALAAPERVELDQEGAAHDAPALLPERHEAHPQLPCRGAAEDEASRFHPDNRIDRLIDDGVKEMAHREAQGRRMADERGDVPMQEGPRASGSPRWS